MMPHICAMKNPSGRTIGRKETSNADHAQRRLHHRWIAMATPSAMGISVIVSPAIAKTSGCKISSGPASVAFGSFSRSASRIVSHAVMQLIAAIHMRAGITPNFAGRTINSTNIGRDHA